jgi:hypothetical protein
LPALIVLATISHHRIEVDEDGVDGHNKHKVVKGRINKEKSIFV